MKLRMPPRNALAAAALTAVAGLTLTACNGDDKASGTAATSSDMPGMAAGAHAAGSAVSALGKYGEDAAGATFFASVLSGDNEVQVAGKPPVGDKDGSSIALMRIQGDEVSFAFTWTGIGTPTLGHIHQGVRGVNGDVKIPFFTEKLPDGKNYVYGTTKVTDAALLQDIKLQPENFYFNLHTAEFPGGAVRGQVFPLPMKVSLPGAIRDSTLRGVVKGAQVYACTKQDDGSFKFTQDNVAATLQGGIKHSFVRPGPAGPPQWIASDGSAVSGKLLNKLDNGPKNIPELILGAQQTGSHEGLLSKTQAVLRLSTVGGIAPAGTCNPSSQPKASVPYTADYLFLATK
ncbi:CHRD domain-containing protein [Streptomyces sp. NPDC088847]|uniref:CHRD domain-containing protein n=1 Tax=Streptomyces sp. NPDC088847 TaxID=3365909 RepID=UPI00380D30E2